MIRNGGSNTLNFQFHDPAPRTVCNGYLPPRRDASRHPGGSLLQKTCCRGPGWGWGIRLPGPCHLAAPHVGRERRGGLRIRPTARLCVSVLACESESQSRGEDRLTHPFPSPPHQCQGKEVCRGHGGGGRGDLQQDGEQLGLGMEEQRNVSSLLAVPGRWADAMTGPEYSRGFYSAQGGQATLTACQLLGSRESPQPGSRGLGVPGTPRVGAHPGDPSPHEAGFLY